MLYINYTFVYLPSYPITFDDNAQISSSPHSADKWHQKGGQDTGQDQAEAADGPLDLSDLVSLGSADDVRGGAEGSALGHGIAYMEEFAHKLSEDVSQDSRGYDHRHSDGTDTAEGFCHRSADGCGHTFRKQGNGKGPVQMEKQAEAAHHKEAAESPADYPDDNGRKIFLQHLYLFVKGEGQTDRRRCHQV